MASLIHITFHSSSSLLLERRWLRLRGHHIMGRYGGGFTSRATVLTEAEPVKLHHDELQVDLFACPICFKRLTRKGPPGLNLPAIYRSGFKCPTCKRTYTSKETFLDLTVTSGTKDYNEVMPTSTELFRSPLVSFVYERGWRQNFGRAGFPGPDEEFKMAQAYFKPVEGGLLLDVSCGSGLFSRKFVKSGSYSGVIALDFSENMLKQCYDFVKQDESLLSANFALARADISRLPFASGSVDAVHAGAALHCWPSPSNAVAEISRVLRSGGIFVATTFLAPSFSSFLPELRPLVQAARQLANTYNNLNEKEIEDLCKACGFINYTSKTVRAFIIFSAQKP
ncbi:unnamed protein product [Victoria cruziana]